MAPWLSLVGGEGEDDHSEDSGQVLRVERRKGWVGPCVRL